MLDNSLSAGSWASARLAIVTMKIIRTGSIGRSNTRPQASEADTAYVTTKTFEQSYCIHYRSRAIRGWVPRKEQALTGRKSLRSAWMLCDRHYNPVQTLRVVQGLFRARSASPRQPP